MNKWTLDWWAPLQLMNKTMGKKWQQNQDLKTSWRDAGFAMAKIGKVPMLKSCTIEIHQFTSAKTGRPPDLVSCYPSAKAFVDGLTNAGVFPDDGFKFVKAISFTQIQRGPRTGLRFIITGEPV